MVDGVEYKRVYKAITGRDGYIRRYLTDARGNILTDEKEVRTERIDGHVIIIFGEE